MITNFELYEGKVNLNDDYPKWKAAQTKVYAIEPLRGDPNTIGRKYLIIVNYIDTRTKERMVSVQDLTTNEFISGEHFPATYFTKNPNSKINPQKIRFMITRFNIFEAVDQGAPEVGDYAICKLANDKGEAYPEVDDFLSKSIGQLIDTSRLLKGGFLVEFTDIPHDIMINNFEDNGNNSGTVFLNKDEIIHWSKTKKELEVFLQSSKFDL